MHEVLELQQFRRNNLNEYITMPEASAKKAEKPPYLRQLTSMAVKLSQKQARLLLLTIQQKQTK
jgi:hypothetical protein